MERTGPANEGNLPRDPAAERYAMEARERQLTEEGEEPSLARLLGELVGDAQHVVRKELELAKVEIQNEVNRLKQSAISFTAGAGMATGGSLLLLFTIVYALADGLAWPMWLSFLVVGGVTTIAGGVLLAVGRARARKVDLVPRETVESLRKDVQWMKEQSPSSKK